MPQSNDRLGRIETLVAKNSLPPVLQALAPAIETVVARLLGVES